MGYVNRSEEGNRDADYSQLDHRKDRLIEEVGNWVNRATTLHGSTTDAAEKTEVLDMRQALIDGMKVKLGI